MDKTSLNQWKSKELDQLKITLSLIKILSVFGVKMSISLRNRLRHYLVNYRKIFRNITSWEKTMCRVAAPLPQVKKGFSRTFSQFGEFEAKSVSYFLTFRTKKVGKIISSKRSLETVSRISGRSGAASAGSLAMNVFKIMMQCPTQRVKS